MHLVNAQHGDQKGDHKRWVPSAYGSNPPFRGAGDGPEQSPVEIEVTSNQQIVRYTIEYLSNILFVNSEKNLFGVSLFFVDGGDP